ncbi:MAG TPA: enoyl-CoA hydratase-related protein [Myxococcota bacterium]|jgi:enoyl-CoA hydratase/carnithine racemase
MALVDVSEENKVVTLTLHRPEAMNALNRGLLDALWTEIENVAVRREIRALILAGSERAFSAGADLKERAGMSAEQVRSFLRRIRGIMDLVERVPMPTIAAIEGVAFGGGMELALACDIRVVGDKATLGLTEVSLGIIPGAGGTQRLPRLIGASKAKELIFTARRLSAGAAHEWGLANHKVDAGSALARAKSIAAEISKCAPIAVEAAKAAIDGGIGVGISEGLLLEQRAYEVTLGTEDRKEALRAFGEKRAPVFEGR